MTPAEITAMVQAFTLLEPLAQEAIAGMIHKLAGANQKVANANQAAIAAGVNPAALPNP